MKTACLGERASSIGMMLPLLALVVLCVDLVTAETSQQWQRGALVRLGSEAVLAVDTENNEEKDVALTLLHKWGLGSERQVVELAEPGVAAEDVMTNVAGYTALVVVVRGPLPPVRRNVTAGQPFLEVDTAEGWPAGVLGATEPLHRFLPAQAINAGAALLEGALGRPLFPLRLALRTFERDAHRGGGPMAVYDFSEGVIYMDRSVTRTLRLLPDAAAGALSDFADGLFGGIASALGTAASSQQAGNGTSSIVPSSISGVSQLLASVGGAVLASVLASQVPVWFCIACPVVLGLLAPFVFNLGSGAVAQAICDHYSLPQDECNDVWYGAFALAMVLSLASAIPIVFVCRLPECARRQRTGFESALS